MKTIRDEIIYGRTGGNLKKTKITLLILGFFSAVFLALSFILTHGGDAVYFSGFLTGWVPDHIGTESVWQLVIYIMTIAICVVVPYMLGSLNFAVMISREKYHDDVRKYGSHNAGMTNMIRVYGKKAGVYTLVGDALKTAAAVLMGRFLAGEYGAYLAALFCVLGHVAPVWYKFKGGKGVVASAMAILILDPLYFLIVFAVFALVYFTSHYMSMSSVAAAFIYPAVVFYGAKMRAGEEVTSAAASSMIFAVFVGLLIIVKHRANIRRVYYGEEKKMYLFKKSKKDSEI